MSIKDINRDTKIFNDSKMEISENSDNQLNKENIVDIEDGEINSDDDVANASAIINNSEAIASIHTIFPNSQLTVKELSIAFRSNKLLAKLIEDRKSNLLKENKKKKIDPLLKKKKSHKSGKLRKDDLTSLTIVKSRVKSPSCSSRRHRKRSTSNNRERRRRSSSQYDKASKIQKYENFDIIDEDEMLCVRQGSSPPPPPIQEDLYPLELYADPFVPTYSLCAYKMDNGSRSSTPSCKSCSLSPSTTLPLSHSDDDMIKTDQRKRHKSLEYRSKSNKEEHSPKERRHRAKNNRKRSPTITSSENQKDNNLESIVSPEESKSKYYELCKFYLTDCCAKKENCHYMHDDFPCKFYYLGIECTSMSKCKFLHGGPLNDDLKTILLNHIEMAPKNILGDFRRLSRESAQALLDITHAKLVANKNRNNSVNSLQTNKANKKEKSASTSPKEPQVPGEHVNIIPSLLDICIKPPKSSNNRSQIIHKTTRWSNKDLKTSKINGRSTPLLSKIMIPIAITTSTPYMCHKQNVSNPNAGAKRSFGRHNKKIEHQKSYTMTVAPTLVNRCQITEKEIDQINSSLVNSTGNGIPIISTQNKLTDLDSRLTDLIIKGPEVEPDECDENSESDSESALVIDINYNENMAEEETGSENKSPKEADLISPESPPNSNPKSYTQLSQVADENKTAADIQSNECVPKTSYKNILDFYKSTYALNGAPFKVLDDSGMDMNKYLLPQSICNYTNLTTEVKNDKDSTLYGYDYSEPTTPEEIDASFYSHLQIPYQLIEITFPINDSKPIDPYSIGLHSALDPRLTEKIQYSSNIIHEIPLKIQHRLDPRLVNKISNIE